MSSSNDPSSEADRDAAGRLHGSESKHGSTQPLPKSKGQEKTKKPPSNAGTKALKLSSSGKPSSTHKKDAKAKAKTVSQSNGELKNGAVASTESSTDLPHSSIESGNETPLTYKPKNKKGLKVPAFLMCPDSTENKCQGRHYHKMRSFVFGAASGAKRRFLEKNRDYQVNPKDLVLCNMPIGKCELGAHYACTKCVALYGETQSELSLLAFQKAIRKVEKESAPVADKQETEKSEEPYTGMPQVETPAVDSTEAEDEQLNSNTDLPPEETKSSESIKEEIENKDTGRVGNRSDSRTPEVLPPLPLKRQVNEIETVVPSRMVSPWALTVSSSLSCVAMERVSEALKDYNNCNAAAFCKEVRKMSDIEFNQTRDPRAEVDKQRILEGYGVLELPVPPPPGKEVRDRPICPLRIKFSNGDECLCTQRLERYVTRAQVFITEYVNYKAKEAGHSRPFFTSRIHKGQDKEFMFFGVVHKIYQPFEEEWERKMDMVTAVIRKEFGTQALSQPSICKDIYGTIEYDDISTSDDEKESNFIHKRVTTSKNHLAKEVRKDEKLGTVLVPYVPKAVVNDIIQTGIFQDVSSEIRSFNEERLEYPNRLVLAKDLELPPLYGPENCKEFKFPNTISAEFDGPYSMRLLTLGTSFSNVLQDEILILHENFINTEVLDRTLSLREHWRNFLDWFVTKSKQQTVVREDYYEPAGSMWNNVNTTRYMERNMLGRLLARCKGKSNVNYKLAKLMKPHAVDLLRGTYNHSYKCLIFKKLYEELASKKFSLRIGFQENPWSWTFGNIMEWIAINKPEYTEYAFHAPVRDTIIAFINHKTLDHSISTAGGSKKLVSDLVQKAMGKNE